jgi:hypothetical protein
LTRTAEARECVYGSVGGEKRLRSKLSLSRIWPAAIGLFLESATLLPCPPVAEAPQRDAFEIAVRMPMRGSVPPPGTWIAACRIPRASKCPTGNRRK